MENTLQNCSETSPAKEFELQGQLLKGISERLIDRLNPRHWDYGGVGKTNAPSIAMANRDRARIFDDVENTTRVVETSLTSHTFDGNRTKRSAVFAGIDCFQYQCAQISSLRSAFLKFSPANNRGIIPQRGISQSISGGGNTDRVLEENMDRDKGENIARNAGEYLYRNTIYGRFTSKTDFPDLYQEIADIYHIPKDNSNYPPDRTFALVNSGMNAEVASNLLLQQYVKGEHLVVFDDSGRYYEHAWAKRYKGDAAFALSTRENTEFVEGDINTTWEQAKKALSDGKTVLIRTDIVANVKQYTLSNCLSEAMLDEYQNLSEEQQKKLIFQIDTTLYPNVDIEALRNLFPSNCSIITVASLNKFHQLGFDMGGLGLITAKMQDKDKATNLKQLMIYSGMTPSGETLTSMDLVCSRKLLQLRMQIISRNSQLMADELKALGIEAHAIEKDTRICKPEFIGGLISIPQLGMRKTSLLISELAEEEIQVDNRTSFGHNYTSIEDVHQMDWSRISVGIEDEDAIRTIVAKIHEVMQLDDATLNQRLKRFSSSS